VKKVFIDSDVVISSLISNTGAAYFLLNKTDLKLFISDKSMEELERVVEELGLNKTKLKKLIKNRFRMINIKKTTEKMNDYVVDSDDAHIVEGAKQAKATFLLTYNTRHYKIDKISQALRIVVTTPAYFLQYLRSIS